MTSVDGQPVTASPATPAVEPSAPPAALDRLRGRLTMALCCLLLTGFAFVQDEQLVTSDTKLDLTADPVGFFGRALHLWDPSAAFGQLQDQAYGYLVPMGPFFALGHAMALPAWVVQRLWLSLLLCAAFAGAARLSSALGVRRRHAALLAGLAYAVAPRMMTLLGPSSVEAVPYVLLPWIVLPLVRGAAGEGYGASERRAAARSAGALFLVGGVNAAATLAVLPVPVLYLLTRAGGPRRRRLVGWWVAGVGLACLWWVLPLLLLGRYSVPFLDYIETGAVTTGTTSLTEVLRGTSHWMSYLSIGGHPTWPAAHLLVAVPALVLNTAVVAGLGLAGLAGRSRERTFLVLTALLGIALLTFGHVGPLAHPGAGAERAALDGALAPFRNIHKLDAVLRLPLAVGVGLLLDRGWRPSLRIRAVALMAAAGSLLAVSAPLTTARLAPTGSYAALPGYWHRAAQWLAAHGGGARALLVPASGFAEYEWGRPMDEPLQALAAGPWAVRSQVPFGSLGAMRVMDAVESRLDDGRGSPGLAAYLARAGVGYLVLRNDLDWVGTGAPRPSLVHQALARSPGLARVAAFGPLTGGLPAAGGQSRDGGLDPDYPAVEIWATAATAQRAVAYPAAGPLVVSGGPESLLDLADAGAPLDRAAFLSGDTAGAGTTGARWIDTDGLRRRERSFADVRGDASATLTADDDGVLGRREMDYLPVPGVRHQTVARVIGARAVRASSATSDAGQVLLHAAGHQPAAAFDGDQGTTWVAGGLTGAVGEWVELDLDHPADPAGLTVTFATAPFLGPAVSAVTVLTDRGSAHAVVAPTDLPQRLPVPRGTTRTVRLRVDGVGAPGPGWVAVRELTLPGVDVSRTLVLPADGPPPGAAGGPAYLLGAARGATAGCVDLPSGRRCDPALAVPGEDDGGLDRTLTVPADATLGVSGTVAALPGAALDALVTPPGAPQVSATSVAVPDPAGRPAAVVDGDRRTSWSPGQGDADPALTLRWPARRAVDRLRLRLPGPAGPPAAVPTRVRVDTGTGGGAVEVPVRADGTVRFPVARTDHLTIHFADVLPAVDVGLTGVRSLRPVAIAEVEVPGVRAVPVDRFAELDVPCGAGPPLRVDGVPVATGVDGTVGDALAGRSLRLVACGDDEALHLRAGEHRVVAPRGAAFAVDALALGLPPGAAPTTGRAVTVQRWAADERTVRVGPGDAAYLALAENANAGWVATLGGHRLAPVRLDGWRQGWALPAGAVGIVRLSYRPDRLYRAGLVAGAVAVLVLLVIGLLPARRGPRPPARAAATGGTGAVAVAIAAAALLAWTAGGWGLLALGAGLAVRHRARRLLPLVAAAGVIVAGAATAWAGSLALAPLALERAATVLSLVSAGALAAAVAGPAADRLLRWARARLSARGA
ncbi:MAG: alpha-(1-_3)-arabinofuranosyltransferase family protein [Frankiaceae bacterium]